jgi:anti-sigma factor ChrR (cupin superfamily)
MGLLLKKARRADYLSLLWRSLEINADFGRRVAVHAARMSWSPSPVPGVERRMLDRVGDEVARATSLVRYTARSRFTAHTHGGGEEFLVLEGVFQDEHGDYPAGSYVRNPPGSHHRPASERGCVLFVKLRQFDPADRTPVRIATYFRPMPLYSHPGEEVRIEQWESRAHIELAVYGGIELLVLEGAFEEGGERFAQHSWLRLPAGASLDAVAGPQGARLWVKSGHLGPTTLQRW